MEINYALIYEIRLSIILNVSNNSIENNGLPYSLRQPIVYLLCSRVSPNIFTIIRRL